MISTASCQRWLISIIIALSGVIWFMLLGYRDLIDPDEGRYAEIAREMLSSGDWITPRLNGFKYFEKPPLQYWGSALSMALLGETNAAARVWCAGLGFIGALWTGFVGMRLYGLNAGMYAFLILLSSFLYIALGHVNTLDMGVSVFLSIAIGALVLAQADRDAPGHARNWMLLAWAALAAATLSKGLIGLVLPGGAVLFYTLWQRDWALWRNLHLGKGLMLFLLLTAPWFMTVSDANPEFAHFFFIHEHFQRFTSDVHERTKSWWYFFMIFAVGILPWAGSVISALLKPSFSWRAEPGVFEASRFLWVYAFFIFFFFSISNSKLPPYILPMFFAVAILAGEKASRRNNLTLDGIAALLLALALVFFAWNIVDFLAKPGKPVEPLLMYRPWIIAAAVLMASAGISALIWRQGKLAGASVFALCSLLAMQMLFWGFQSFSTKRSTRYLSEAIKPYSDNGIKIYSLFLADHSLTYYLGKKVQTVYFTGELKFGIEQEPERWIGDQDRFESIWLNSEQAIALLPEILYEMWLEENMPMRLIYQDWGHIAVARR